MNKFGIKLYCDVNIINGIHYTINSINHDIHYYKYKFRVIDCEYFGIKLRIEKKDE